ncbi:hypothetical protein J3B02_003355 [Coemansia erecta]|nr:hypothetical protein J3B02_003355 [Coemansia erecta]
MNIFDGNCAWFAPNVPAAHIHAWISDGGIQIKDPRKPIIQYYFSNAFDDDNTLELVRSPEKVVYRSAWIMDSSHTRTKQPLGPYALNQRSSQVASSVVHASPATSVRAHMARRSFTPHKHDWHSTTPYATKRPRSVAGITGEFYSPTGVSIDRYMESLEETRSVASSRASATSSIISGYGRRQHIVSRFVINADEVTRASILADVADFTPNEHGFVAYKIPKLAV